MKKIIVLLLLLATVLSIVSCVKTEADTDYAPGFTEASANFSAELLKACGAGQGENVMISPASVLIALAMTANGARGITLEQMQSVLCGELSLEDLNTSINALCGNLPNEKDCTVKIANSVWFKDKYGFTINNKFLKTNETYYRAEIFKEPFNEETLAKINAWVSEKTDGKIKNILDSIDEDSVTYLINAVAFDAKWEDSFNPENTHKMRFTPQDKDGVMIDFMRSTENKYINDSKASGFVKDYAGGRYKFVALLPKDGTTLSDFMKTLDGEHLSGLLKSAKNKEVHINIPKFTSEYNNELSDELISLGMVNAFDADLANFKNLGESKNKNIYINRVIHRTYINFAEEGTKASAATVVEMYEKTGAAPSLKKEPLTINFNRPFAYFIIDSESEAVIFAGTYETT